MILLSASFRSLSRASRLWKSGWTKKDSHNSSKPPSSDGLKKPIKSRKRHPGSKKVGGQTGHIGVRLEPVEKPEHVAVHPVIHCHACAKSLEGIAPKRFIKRQVFALPAEIKLDAPFNALSGSPFRPPFLAAIPAE
ncbi:MAG: hypothetical protein JXA13_07305 [Anaerolineales bacterium]|nr:hypothetical protein [Anaerolineales bacterium]